MRNNYLDNIQFCYDLLISILFPLKYFYCFLLQFLFFALFVVRILMFALFIHHLSKIADWQSKAQTFKFLTRERSKSYYFFNISILYIFQFPAGVQNDWL